jgi:hypothetical protein
MILKEYLKALNGLIKNCPAVLNYEIITSKDDEGNGFNKVAFEPSIGVFNDGEFYSGDTLDEMGFKFDDTNAVCLN